MEEMKLYYWSFRGLKEPIAHLIEYCGVPYKFIPVANSNEWNKLRDETAKKGFGLASLPMLEYQGKYISEPLAIMSHVALMTDKAEMTPGDYNFGRFMQVYGVISDLFSDITKPAYSSVSPEAFRQAYLKACQINKIKIESIDNLVGKNKWLLGDDLSIIDFKLAEVIDKMKAIEDDLEVEIISQYLNLETYLGRFLGIPEVKEYRTSDRFEARPYNGEAVWQ